MLLWCVASKPEDTSWEVIQPFVDVVNEWSFVNTAMKEWGQEGVLGTDWSPCLFQWEMIIASPETAVTCSLEILLIIFY